MKWIFVFIQMYENYDQSILHDLLRWQWSVSSNRRHYLIPFLVVRKQIKNKNGIF